MKLLIVLLLSGCASTMTQDELEYVRNERVIKWEMCQDVYKRHGIPTVSYHTHRRGRKHRDSEVYDDLSVNQCHRILRQMGLWE